MGSPTQESGSIDVASTVSQAVSPRAGPRHDSARRQAIRRFVRHKAALVGLCVLVLISVLAIAAPVIAPHDPNFTRVDLRNMAPSPTNLLGTDGIGRDVLSRLLYASQVSLAVGISAAFVATAIGLIVGLIAGTVGGLVDMLAMRLTDVVLSVPSLIAIAIVAGLVGGGFWIVVLVLGLFGWTEAARVVRAAVLSLREQDFVIAARGLGGNDLWVIRKHLLFHALPPLTVTATFTVARALLTEAGLSFLGIGVQPPQATWGNMLSDAQGLNVLTSLPWLWIPPGVAIFITVVAVNLVGDGLRDALDPHDLH